MSESTKHLDMELSELGASHHRGDHEPSFGPEEPEADFAITFGAPPPAAPTYGSASMSASASAAPTSAVSPERVRFAAPAVLTFDGYEEKFEVSILNLSDHGVACSGPQGLAAGDRLRLQFRLNLAADPQTFLCEVIWTQNSSQEEADATYGLRFLGVPDDQAQLVRDAVRERVEGRAGEWPMPIIPPPSFDDMAAPSAPSRETRFDPLLAAVVGMAAGALVTVGLVAAFTSSSSDAPVPGSEPAVSSNVDTPEVRPGSSDAAPLAAADEPAAPLVLPAVPAPLDTAPVAPAAAAPALQQVNTKPKVAAALEPPPVQAPPSKAATSPVRQRKIGLLRVEEQTDQVALTLLADGPVASHSQFWLQNPQRLVVDIPNRQSGFQSKLFEVGHPLVSRLRVGQHPGKVRFVIETGSNVAPNVVAKEQGNGLRVELRRKNAG